MMRIWLSFCLFCFLTVTAVAKPRVILATTTWEPYVQNNPLYKGYVYNIVTSAFENSGYDVVVKFMPWAKAIDALKAGKVDGVFPKYYSALDSHDMAFSSAFTGGPIALYHRKDKAFKIPVADPAHHLSELFAALSGYRFGVVSGYQNFPSFDDNEAIKKVSVADDKRNLEQLYAGKVDLIIIDHFTAAAILKNQLGEKFQNALTFAAPALGYQQLYLAVSKKTSNGQKIIRDFNRGLKAIKKNGKLNEILDKDAHYTGRLVA